MKVEFTEDEWREGVSSNTWAKILTKEYTDAKEGHPYHSYTAYWSGGGMSSPSTYLSWWSILYCQNVYGYWLVWIIYCIVGTHDHANDVESNDTNPVQNFIPMK